MPPPVSAEELERLDILLRSRIGPEYVQYRPQGGSNVPFLANHDVIALANETFGFDGWASTITNMVMDIETEDKNGRWNHGVTATVKVTLVKIGTFHEDVGYGQSENCKSRIQGLQKAKKEAVTDARKRALRIFGNGLGNCLPDKNWLKLMRGMAASAGKAPPIDKEDLRKPGKLGNGPNRRAAQAEYERLSRIALENMPEQATSPLAITEGTDSDNGVHLPQSHNDQRHQQQRQHTHQHTKHTGALAVSNGHHKHDPNGRVPELRSSANHENYPVRGTGRGEPAGNTNSRQNNGNSNSNTYASGSSKQMNNIVGANNERVNENAKATHSGENAVVQVSAPDGGHSAPGPHNGIGPNSMSRGAAANGSTNSTHMGTVTTGSGNNNTATGNQHTVTRPQGSTHATAQWNAALSTTGCNGVNNNANTGGGIRARTYPSGNASPSVGSANAGMAANASPGMRPVNGAQAAGVEGGDSRGVGVGVGVASATHNSSGNSMASMAVNGHARPNNTHSSTRGQAQKTATSANRPVTVGSHSTGIPHTHSATAQPRKAGVSTTAAPYISGGNGSGTVHDTHRAAIAGIDAGMDNASTHAKGSPTVLSRPSATGAPDNTHTVISTAASQYANANAGIGTSAGANTATDTSTGAGAPGSVTMNIHAELPVPKKLPGMDMSVPGGKGYRANQNAVYNAKNGKKPGTSGGGSNSQKRTISGQNGSRTSGGGVAMGALRTSSTSVSPHHHQPATTRPVSAADAMDFDIDECTRLAEGVRTSQENTAPKWDAANQGAPAHKRAKTCYTEGQRLGVQTATDSLAELSSSQQNSFFDDL